MIRHLVTLIDKSIDLISRFERTALIYSPNGYNVAFSGGKDSQVIVELARMAGVKHLLTHNLTTLDAPETVHFIKDNYPDCSIVRPRYTFFQLCLKHKILPTGDIRFCCKTLKENSAPGLVTITGVRRSESYRRKDRQEILLKTRRGNAGFKEGDATVFEKWQYVQDKCLHGKDALVLNPILEWEQKDVFYFLKDRNIEVCPLYKTRNRLGCLFCCMASTKKIYQDVKDYPLYYAAFLRTIRRMREKGAFRSLRGFSDEEIFRWWASKKSVKSFMTEKKQLNLDLKL